MDTKSYNSNTWVVLPGTRVAQQLQQQIEGQWLFLSLSKLLDTDLIQITPSHYFSHLRKHVLAFFYQSDLKEPSVATCDRCKLYRVGVRVTKPNCQVCNSLMKPLHCFYLDWSRCYCFEWDWSLTMSFLDVCNWGTQLWKYTFFNIFLKEGVKCNASLIFSKYPWLKSQLQDVAKNNKITMQVLW